MLVLLDPRGTRTISGAGSFSIGGSATATATPSTFAALIGNSGTRQVRTGAVRGSNTAQPRVASLWYVDTAKNGTVCLRDLTRATLWRSAMTMPVTMTLTRVSDGRSVPIAFSAGQAVRAWPVAEMPLVAGTEYRVSGAGLATPTVLRVVQVGATSDAVDEVAATLIGNGCQAQLDVLVDAGTVPTMGS